MLILPREIFGVIIRFVVGQKGNVAFATLSLVCKDFRMILPDPIQHVPVDYLYHHVKKQDTEKVRAILARITANNAIDPSLLSKKIGKYFLFTLVLQRCDQIIAESIFLHDILRNMFPITQHRRMLRNMTKIGQAEYLLKALSVIDFKWDVLSLHDQDELGRTPHLAAILRQVLKGTFYTIKPSDLLPLMFQVEPRFYKCIRLDLGDHWIYPASDRHSGYQRLLEEVKYIPADVELVFSEIVSKKKDWVQEQVRKGEHAPRCYYADDHQ